MYYCFIVFPKIPPQEGSRMDLLTVANKRSVPGILILDRRKKPTFLNPVALDILNELNRAKASTSSNTHGIRIPKEISNLYDSLKKRFHPFLNEQPESVFSETILITSKNETFCCRGFFLQGQDNSFDRIPHIIVLIEKISEHHHADLAKCKEHFDLTNRQIDIVERLVSGASNKVIAEELCVSEDTIKGHLKHIMKQFKVNSRTEILSTIYHL